MWFTSVQDTNADNGAKVIQDLVRQMGQLLRHPNYRRGNIVSPLLKRHLPSEAGYAWQGEDMLRAHLIRAKLDPAQLEYLRVGVRSEMENLRKPAVR